MNTTYPKTPLFTDFFQSRFEINPSLSDLGINIGLELGVSQNLEIHPLTCTFTDRATEAGFQRFLSEQDRNNHVAPLIAGALVFAAFSVLDFVALQEPWLIITIRLFGAGVTVGFAMMLAHDWFWRRYQLIAPVLIVFGGSVINFAIWREPNLDTNYFVGLITMAIFSSFLQRLSFVRSAITILAIFLGYHIAISNKPELGSEKIFINLFFLISMFGCCLFGTYLLERFRRKDYIKAQLIEDQNKQLSVLLDETRHDNKRKVAALNMLLHLVKTPVHQISGFSDIVLSKLSEEETRDNVSACLDSAKYIKAASNDLSTGVSTLLAYHKLDEIDRNADIEDVNILELISDTTASLDETVSVSIKCDVKRLSVDRRLMETAVSNIIGDIQSSGVEALSLSITVSEKNETVQLRFTDNGPGMTDEEFQSLITPLTDIENYLNGDGSSIKMGLRTAARAMDIAGGSITYGRKNGSVFTLSFPLRAATKGFASEEIVMKISRV